MSKMFNDFGMTPAHMLVYGREATEDRIAIRISDLTRHGTWQEREILLDRKLKLSGVEMTLVRDPHFYDWYIKLLNPGPQNICDAISLTQTKCKYGGERQWFVCPDTDCQKRVGVLYKSGDDFRCRKCLDLDYRSRKRNYRSLEPAIVYMHMANEMIEKYHSEINKFYNGKPTKKTIRFEKLKAKSLGGMSYYGDKLKKQGEK